MYVLVNMAFALDKPGRHYVCGPDDATTFPKLWEAVVARDLLARESGNEQIVVFDVLAVSDRRIDLARQSPKYQDSMREESDG